MKGFAGLPFLLHLLLLHTSISLPDCCAIDSISNAKPLQDPNFLISSGGTFKLGFFSPENTTNRYAGIMYNVPKTSVVWVANRNNPLIDSSGVLTILEDGNLVVLNGKKDILWSSNATSPNSNSSAQLLEDGNLVLRDNSNGRSVWESFLNPTDTFLPGSMLGFVENKSIQLTSWRSPSDPATGNFTLGVDPLRIPEMFLWNRGVVHYRTGPWDGNVFIGVPGMGTHAQSRGDLLVRNYTGTEYFTYGYSNTTFLHYQLSSLGDVLGKFFNDNRDWAVSSTTASDCNVYGKCGPNGICDPKGSPICSCVKGFYPKNNQEWTRGNWSGGCSRKTVLKCSSNNSSGQKDGEDGYFHLTNVKVPDLSDRVATSEEECGSECLNNCSCSAYTFVVGIGCMHWADSLVDIQKFSKSGSDLYLRVAHSELDNGRSNLKKKVIIATSAVGGSLLLAVSVYILWNWWLKRRGEARKSELMLSDNYFKKTKLEELPLYSYETLEDATDNFHAKNKLGQGGFGPVYKGKLVNGQAIAVKRLSNSSTQGIKEFMNEVRVISKLQHRNLVRLLGCCVERDEKMLVYEYMPNKSLDAYVYGSQKQDLLDWNRRFLIIEGISRGLLYLHRDSRLRIIHRDLKASNILLDEELNPKISDFGMARIFGCKQDQANTNRVVGTYGYMAPEYAMGGKFSEKSDVYSFGVLLLEILSGKRNTVFYFDEENLSLLGYAWKLLNENDAVKLTFKENPNPTEEMEIQRCIQVGLLCVQESADDRPNMSNVVSMLNNEIGELPRPKIPAYTARFSLSQDQSSPQRKHLVSVNGVSLTDVQGR